MNRRPLVWFAACWVAGSASAASLEAAGVWLACGALLALAAALALLGRASRPLAAVCLAAFALAAGHRMWADERNVTALPDLLAAAEGESPSASFAVEAEGTIVSAVEIDGDRVRFRVMADAIRESDAAAPRRVRERLLVLVRLAAQPDRDIAARWQRGDRVRVAGELELPAGATNSGGFDYRRYLRSQRIHWLLKAEGIGAVDAAPGPNWSAAALLGRADAVRGWLGARMDELYPDDQAGYMKGLVLGIRESLDPEQFRQFSELGLTHVLAISGLHVAVFLFALGGLLRLLRLTRERTFTALLVAVPLYVLLTGASPSVVRAGIMAMLGLVAARMGRLKDGLHVLAAAALAMLIWDPFLLANVSFQLSFLVTAGLIVGVPPLRRALPRRTKIQPLIDLACVTIVAQAVSFPLSIYYFNQFHLLSLFANLLLVPFISSVVMPLGAVSLIAAAIWPAGAEWFAWPAVWGNRLTFGVVGLLAEARALKTIWATPPVIWIAAWYGALALLGAYLNGIASQRPELHAQPAPAGRPAWPEQRERLEPGGRTAWLQQHARPEPAGRSARPREFDRFTAPGRSGEREWPAFAAGPATEPLPGISPRNAPGLAAVHSPHGAEPGIPRATGQAADPVTAPLAAWSGPAPASWSASPAGSAGEPFAARRSDAPACFRKRLRPLSGAGIVLLLGLLLAYAYWPDWLDRTARLQVLDVGQGDALLVRTPSGKHLLIDGGGTVSFRKPGEEWRTRNDPFEVGRDVVVPLLMKRGVKEIDLLVLSHLDHDHIGGLKAVVESIPVKGLLWNGTVKPTPEALALFRLALDRGIPVYGAASGQTWQPDGHSRVTVLWPASAVPAGGTVPVKEDQNSSSVVLLLELYERTFLLTGDIDATVERLLAAAGGETVRRPAANIDVMKIAHHGSRYSTSGQWLSYWRPLAAVISAGRNNMYGHPHPDVLARLRAASVPHIFRTDRDGEVQFAVTRAGLYARTVIPGGRAP